MSLETDTLEITKEVAKELAKDTYQDIAHPALKTTGEIINLIPRAIKVALNPLQKWIMEGEYNLEETKKLLEHKLENVDPENIVSPEPYVAVPALQYISYCMDNEELRDMYANLLANSMNSVVKNGVHPSYVEIIKQLSPDEAKILKYLLYCPMVPTITLYKQNKERYIRYVVKDFSDVGFKCGCEQVLDVNLYFNNLARLGLLSYATDKSTLADRTLYVSLEKHPYILEKSEQLSKEPDGCVIKVQESYVQMTDFGKAFSEICISKESVEQ